MSLSGQRVVVIGGTSGIGHAVARAALDAGAAVHIGSSSAERLEAALARLGDGAGGSLIDVREEPSVEAFFASSGPLDHLVFSAGDWTRRKTQIGPKFDLADAKASFDTRFWGALLAIKHALTQLATNGSITLTSGLYAHRPAKGTSLTTALTGATEHLIKGLAIDLAPIRVNVVTAGFIDTEAWAGLTDEMKQGVTAHYPLARPGLPAEVAEAYLYFMRAGYTTGQVSIVDGGGLIA
jgi:NAD(P)-dependent dehydrogenase (short-subunit alcohol dehydrogenase family)